MSRVSKRMQVIVGVLALVMLLGAATSEARMVPKVDNVIFFVDQSGSMYMRHQECGEVLKMALAKQILYALNDAMCEGPVKGGLFLFAPFQPIVQPGPYDKAKMAAGIKSIKDSQEIFGRLTPMGPGFDSLDRVLAGQSGKTAVIVISDGMSNLGPDPVAEARKIYSAYPNVCIHVISLADRKDGKEILARINKLNSCSVLANGCALLKEGVNKFVNDVLCAEEVVAPTKETLILRGIHFDFDKYNIKPEWAPVLDEAASRLQANPNMTVVIEGHTDGIGTERYNQVLSEKRANAVYSYLVKRGISPARMKTVGYGKTRPIADNSTEEGRAMNRRVEFKVTK